MLTGTNLGNLGPARALFQVLCGACYAAVASFLLPGQGFQTVFFYLCGWKIKFQIRILMGQSHLREQMDSSTECSWVRDTLNDYSWSPTRHRVRPLLGWLVYNACFCDKRVLNSSFIWSCISIMHDSAKRARICTYFLVYRVDLSLVHLNMWPTNEIYTKWCWRKKGNLSFVKFNKISIRAIHWSSYSYSN